VLNQNSSILFGGGANKLSFGDIIGVGTSPNLSLGNTVGISAAQTANAQFGGSVSSAIRVVNSSYFLADDDHTVLCNNASGLPNVIITPPAPAASNRGRVYIIKRVNPNIEGTNDNCLVANLNGVAGNVALQGPDGALTTDLTGVTIQSDGANWWTVGTITGTVHPTPVQGVATGIVTTNLNVYGPLLDGPSATVVIPPSGQVQLTMTAEASGSSASNGNACSTAFMSISLSGHPSLDPSIVLDANSLRVTGNVPNRASITVMITGMPVGATVTFEAWYKNVLLSACGGARFNARQVVVTPM
jgi:hypothetical protein